ncbi:hypothetical protein Vadar_026132 [Vaccinium darrowii]|uniref:Uncharacterized protein n=1 Tax=Vaccinium darrowii TaxID=229202 RepID=A0ACB7Y2K9_9ERIC|nr:hypothetical protein Vadar_026132 [Vaccinium darrowii]
MLPAFERHLSLIASFLYLERKTTNNNGKSNQKLVQIGEDTLPFLLKPNTDSTVVKFIQSQVATSHPSAFSKLGHNCHCPSSKLDGIGFNLLSLNLGVINRQWISVLWLNSLRNHLEAMNPPANGVEVKPEAFEQVKEAGPLLHCDLMDTEIVHKIAQVFLPGLASACVDNTTGGLFKSPASVAVDIRKEMVEYLTQRSETFVAESVILEGGPEAQVSVHPYDIISDFVDDFASTKRNIFSRVSGWLLSERREDRIDDFVQEMELNGFWFMERREAVAQNLLKNVDFRNTIHCDMKFNSAEELAEHSLLCSFRSMNCTNEGCNARFCASHLVDHESICPFKILPCEQNCSDSIMRREMDKHCITVCPMKQVNCPFYPVGCQSSIPQSTIEQHRLENLHAHLLFVLQVIHKDAPLENLNKRVDQLKESASSGRLSDARDVRSLTFATKDLEAEIGPLEVDTNSKNFDEHAHSQSKNEESTQLATEKEETVDSSTIEEERKESTKEKEECTKGPSEVEKYEESPTKKELHFELPTREEKWEDPSLKDSIKDEERIESTIEKEECADSPPKMEHRESPTKKEERTEDPSIKDSTKDEESIESTIKKEECTDSPPKMEYRESPTKKEERTEDPSIKDSIKDEERIESTIEKEVCADSPPKMEY